MKCICVTGATQSDLDLVSNILQRAGMNLPKPANRGDLIDIAAWHEQVLAMDKDDMETNQAIPTPGRFMEQLASDIFVANIKADTWGWADTRSTWLLDFWVNFAPHLYFVLVYVSPQQMLANAISSQTDIYSVDAVIDTWHAHYQRLLRFHLRNPQRSLFVDAGDCAENSYALIKRCAKDWKLPLIPKIEMFQAPVENNSLGLYLAHHLCRDYSKTIDLQHELNATITRLGDREQKSNILQSPENIIADYRVLLDRSGEIEKTIAAQKLIETLQIEVELINQDKLKQDGLLVEQQALIEAQIHERNQHIQLSDERQTRIEALTQANVNLAEDISLIAARRDIIETLQIEVELINQDKLKQDELLVEQQALIEALIHERDQHIQLSDERQTRIEALTQANANLAEDNSQITARRDIIEVEAKELSQARDEQAKLATERQAQIDHLIDAQAQNSELLLLELHQSHLESEHYFQLLMEMQSRWQRLLLRDPTYCDYESIEVLPEASDNVVKWRLTNAYISGRSLPVLEFKTYIEDGIAGMIFSYAAKDNTLISRWPKMENQADELVLIPAGNHSNIYQRIEVLLDLAASDWKIFYALICLLEASLQNPKTLKLSAGFNSLPLVTGLAELRGIIEKFPATLRYDQISLKREQLSPNYESLWLCLENLSVGDKHWSKFEFRFSCFIDAKSPFGANPKFEFPEVSSAFFEDWFVESSDEFGAKFELRFAVPESLMDVNVWQRLSQNDQNFLDALITRLPSILVSAQNLNIQLKRQWEDWINMAKEIQRIYLLRVGMQPIPTENNPTTTNTRKNK